MRLAQGDQAAVDILQRVRFSPRHRLAVLAFAQAAKPLFVPVKHAGHTGEGHLQQHRQLHFVDIFPAQRQIPADVMAVQQIQLGKQGVFPVAQQKGGNIGIEGFRIHRFLREKSAAIPAEIVIHRGIHHIPVQIMGGVFPDLPDDDGIRLCRLYRGTEGAEEAVVQLVRHVQPPAVDVKLPYPVDADVAEILP